MLALKFMAYKLSHTLTIDSFKIIVKRPRNHKRATERTTETRTAAAAAAFAVAVAVAPPKPFNVNYYFGFELNCKKNN